MSSLTFAQTEKDISRLNSVVSVESTCSEAITSAELNPFTVNLFLSPARLSLRARTDDKQE